MRNSFCAALAIVLAGAATAQVPVTGREGVTLNDLVGTDTLVSVVLKESFARDSNLKVLEIETDYIAFENSNGRRTPYRISSIHEIRIQDGIRLARRLMGKISALSADDEEVVNKAKSRAIQIFDNERTSHLMRMKAAALAGALGEEEALAYLAAFSEVDDVTTSIYASTYLYIAGDEVDPKVVENGMASGLRKTRATSARLAGVVGDPTFSRTISNMLADSTPDQFSAAAVAAGGLNDSSFVPILIEKGIKALNEDKAEAAVFALGKLGGAADVRTLEGMLNQATGLAWFHLVRTLSALESPMALELLAGRCLNSPVYGPRAALELGREAQWDGLEYLREFLQKPRDPNRANLILRANMAAALIEGGDLTAKIIIQDLLGLSDRDIFEKGRSRDDVYKRETVKAVKIVVCNLLAAIAQRNLISLMRPVIDDPNPEIALAACEAAVAPAQPEYIHRLQRVRTMFAVGNPAHRVRVTASEFKFELP